MACSNGTESSANKQQAACHNVLECYNNGISKDFNITAQIIRAAGVGYMEAVAELRINESSFEKNQKINEQVIWKEWTSTKTLQNKNNKLLHVCIKRASKLELQRKS